MSAQDNREYLSEVSREVQSAADRLSGLNFLADTHGADSALLELFLSELSALSEFTEQTRLALIPAATNAGLSTRTIARRARLSSTTVVKANQQQNG